MVLGHHLILSAYGFWLPNDPRGSWSDFVRGWELMRFGPASQVDTHQSLARQPHDRALRKAARESLKYPPVHFNGLQARSIANGFALATAEAQYVLWACAIMPDHVHLVIARHERTIEQIAPHLKARASMRLHKDGLHPLSDHAKPGESPPSPWAVKWWNCYLDSASDIGRAIAYVEENPPKAGLKAQRWKMVREFNSL